MNAIRLQDLHIGSIVYKLSGWTVTPEYINEIIKNEPACGNAETGKKQYRMSFRSAPIGEPYIESRYTYGYANVGDTVAITQWEEKYYFNLDEVQEAQKAWRQHMYDVSMQELQAKAKQLAVYQEELDKPLFGEDFNSDEIPESIQKEFAEEDK